MKAVVHNQKYNSPLGLYSAENVAETLVTQTKVLTNGAAPVSVVYPKMSNVAGTKRSEVYRMVQNDEDEGKFRGQRSRPVSAEYPILQSQSFLKLQRSLELEAEASSVGSGYSPSSPVASPTNMIRRQPQAPAPPPKPAHTGNVKPGPGNWTSGAQPHQPQSNKPQQQAPRPQPQQQQAPPRPQPQQQAPPRPQQQPQSPAVQQQKSQYLSEQERYQLEQAKLQQRPQYQPQFMPQQQRHVPPPPTSNYNTIAPKSTSTFQSIIPTESHPGVRNDGDGGFANWSPTTGRKSVWPPPKSQEALLTSSQSIKWGGGSPAKKFIWPPPKDHVQVQEETDDSGLVRVVYREVPDAQRARTYVSPRAPVRLGAVAWEPYSGRSDQDGSYNLSSGPGRRLRRFNDLFTPNSTRLPPTYRAPPGTQHVEYE